MTDIMQINAKANTRRKAKKKKKTKTTTKRAGAVAAKKVVTKATRNKEVPPSMVALDVDVNLWAAGLAIETNKSKREIINSAISFAREHSDFGVETYVPPSVEKWLAKTGRTLA